MNEINSICDVSDIERRCIKAAYDIKLDTTLKEYSRFKKLASP